MKKLLLCLALMPAMNSHIMACEACGCAASNPYFGLLPQTQTNFIGFQYIDRKFNTNIQHHGSASVESANEHYRTFQVWSRVHISKRIQLIGILPYSINTQHEEGEHANTIDGLGDATLIANFKLVNKENCSLQQTLLIGGGVKLPTGNYNTQSVESGQTLPNMQPGTNSWDFVANANYTVRRKAIGMNVDASYTATTANKEDYKFGNRTSMGISGFYQLRLKQISILPLAGVRYDQAAKDYLYYSSGIMDEDGGGWQLFASQGIQAYYKRVGIQLMCYEPLSQHYMSGFVKTKFRSEVGFIVRI
jgi:hypothetical protein